MSDSQIYISLMAAMLSSLIFRLTICISYVFHFHYHVYSFVEFNKSSLKKMKIKLQNPSPAEYHILFGKQIVSLLLSVYLPCDNYTSSASAEFSECIGYIESLFNSMDCNVFICRGDLNKWSNKMS